MVVGSFFSPWINSLPIFLPIGILGKWGGKSVVETQSVSAYMFRKKRESCLRRPVALERLPFHQGPSFLGLSSASSREPVHHPAWLCVAASLRGGSPAQCAGCVGVVVVAAAAAHHLQPAISQSNADAHSAEQSDVCRRGAGCGAVRRAGREGESMVRALSCVIRPFFKIFFSPLCFGALFQGPAS